MHRQRSVRAVTAALAVTVLAGVAAVTGQATAGHAATATSKDRARQHAFAAAAREFHVPERLLLAVSYAQSRWDDHHGRPSTTGAYGPMALVGRPSGAVAPRGLPAGPESTQSLDRAARLIHASPARLRTDPAANVRGGAALLAAQEKKLAGRTPAAAGEWYAAVARFSGSTTEQALTFADDVYRTLRSGASRTTADGQRVRLGGGAVTPDKSGVTRLRLTKAAKRRTECPAKLDCSFVPAAYKRTDPKDPGAYGNYDTAHRPHGPRIRYIVIHDTEETYAKTRRLFTDPTSQVSAHYVVRSSDGQVTQMVRTRDVAWQAGNWHVNSHSIGVEHEGYEAKGATWFTEPMYRSSARLVRYLAHRFDIPMDRGHVIGHDNVPATGASGVAGMHTDPGPFWDWGHYMDLLHRRDGHAARYSAHAGQVEIAPDFDHNRPPVTTCSGGKCTKLPSQGASFVYLRAKPSDDAPLLGDPKLHPGKPGTTRIQDWGDRASAGQTYAVAGRKPGWTAIWYAGTVGWFRDSAAAPVTRPAHGRTVTPRGSSAATYGVAYPPAGKFPKAIPAPAVTPLPYTLKKDQRYTVIAKVTPAYYYAKTIDSSLPSDHTVVRGGPPYYAIQLGHRIAYVRSGDVRTG